MRSVDQRSFYSVVRAGMCKKLSIIKYSANLGKNFSAIIKYIQRHKQQFLRTMLEQNTAGTWLVVC